MEVDRPGPGEELNTGEETVPRPAATAIVLRDGEGAAEVLLVQRNPEQRFMGGAWVFPGGAVHGDDDGPAAAAVRELEEEASLTIDDPGRLLGWSRWITPREVKIRFDTFFYVVESPPGAEPKVDGSECVDLRWMTPAAALDAYSRGELTLVFPTIKHLEELAEFESTEQVLEAARGRTVEAVTPVVVVGDSGARVLLPGEPGYEDAAAGTQPPG